MNDLLKQGLTKNLVSFDADQKNITYVRHSKRFRFTFPEEKVGSDSYLSLVIDNGYSNSLREQVNQQIAVFYGLDLHDRQGVAQ